MARGDLSKQSIARGLSVVKGTHLLYRTRNGKLDVGRSYQIRRVMYGRAPEGLEWLETCGVMGCCTKAHLELAKDGAGLERAKGVARKRGLTIRDIQRGTRERIKALA